MKMGKKNNGEYSQEEKTNRDRNRAAKGSLRMKQFAFEENRPKKNKKKSG